MGQFEVVVHDLLHRMLNETFLDLEAADEHGILLSMLVNAVLTDLPSGHAERVVSCFCSSK